MHCPLPLGLFGKPTIIQWRSIYSVTLMAQVKHSGSQNKNMNMKKELAWRRGVRLEWGKYWTHVTGLGGIYLLHRFWAQAGPWGLLARQPGLTGESPSLSESLFQNKMGCTQRMMLEVGWLLASTHGCTHIHLFMHLLSCSNHDFKECRQLRSFFKLKRKNKF